jgi:large subunit ribosomal protein L6
MSRVGKYPVTIPEGVTVDLQPNLITVKGKKGELSTRVLGNVKVTMEGNEIAVATAGTNKFARSMWGTTRSNINNLIIGVTEGFTKELELRGVGYRVNQKGSILVLSLGYSHDIYFSIPKEVEVKVDPKANTISLHGANKQQVGQLAADIRALRKPEPYKGKGVRYVGEYVMIKEGKKK